MILAQPVLSEDLRLGRRALEGFKCVQLLEDWQWSQAIAYWFLHCRLTVDETANNSFPSETDWYVLAEPNYPWGTIKFLPAKINGIKQTYHHQLFNREGNKDLPWRTGDICLNTPLHGLTRDFIDIEPHSSQDRLHWYFERALEWCKAATNGTLVNAGDPFELPHFPEISDPNLKLAFSEGPETFAKWNVTKNEFGYVDLFDLPNTNYLIAKNFYSANGELLITSEWGKVLDDAKFISKNIWIRIENTPILEPWQAPETWRQLRQIFQSQTLDLDNYLRKVVKTIRDKHKHFLLVGFKIPATIGSDPTQIHWQTILLPALSSGVNFPNGFRANEIGYWRRDRSELLADDIHLNWIGSENWHYKEISNRGQVNVNITSKKVVIIGAGALGSAVAELFVRTGFQNINVIDSDEIEIGNLVRHTLTINSLNQPKAINLASHLNLISPHAKVIPMRYEFPPTGENECKQINKNQIIIDCTGSDEVLNAMELFDWSDKKLFVSISFNLLAQRLYCFSMVGNKFSKNAFDDAFAPWRLQDIENNKDFVLPREGVGCWHPVFPARADDIWFLASTAFKYIVNLMEREPEEPKLIVFEQDKESPGIKKIDLSNK